MTAARARVEAATHYYRTLQLARRPGTPDATHAFAATGWSQELRDARSRLGRSAGGAAGARAVARGT